MDFCSLKPIHIDTRQCFSSENMSLPIGLSLSTIPKRRNRTTAKQTQILEAYFLVDDMPDNDTRNLISKEVGMPPKSVHIW